MKKARWTAMGPYPGEGLAEALGIVTTTIVKCEKAQLKFSEGTSQHTLLKNRLNALYLAKALMTAEAGVDRIPSDALTEALRPLSSIISKCENARSKYTQGTANYNRYQKLIQAMEISKALISDELSKRSERHDL